MKLSLFLTMLTLCCVVLARMITEPCDGSLSVSGEPLTAAALAQKSDGYLHYLLLLDAASEPMFSEKDDYRSVDFWMKHRQS